MEKRLGAKLTGKENRRSRKVVNETKNYYTSVSSKVDTGLTKT